MMALFKKLFAKEEAPKVETVKGGLYAPITGNYIPLDQIPDAVFSQGVLGPGCGIEPEEELVVAPCSGTISTMAETKHAVGITMDNGAELLIHVGMDTVDMNGDGFAVKVKEGQKITCGQPLLSFSFAKIKAAGHPATTAFVVTNADDFGSVTLDTGKRFEKTAKVGQID
jgi:glucose-specific phosphotransferase system IIA component